jgi:CheY-like chemotaxis protein
MITERNMNNENKPQSNPVKISRTLLNAWRVLVVDDEEDSQEVAMRILRYYGATVFTANNGEEGLSFARNNPNLSLIISDLSMPILDGWGMMEALKKDRRTLEIPVIALTAHAMRGDRQKAISAGFHNHLTKPLTPSTFINDLLNIVSDLPGLDLTPPGSQ